jgi:hypothetical protein
MNKNTANSFALSSTYAVMPDFLEKKGCVMNSEIVGRIAKLPALSAPDLKKLWRDLYGKEPPPFNRVYFIRRLAYRLQELAYGVDSRALESRLELHARQYMDVRGKVTRKAVDIGRPIAGTRLMREYQGEEHHVTVLKDGYEYLGKRYRSLTGIARSITGTQWSGPVFFGLKRQGGRS